VGIAMIDWLIVARDNDYGLTRDAEILAAAIAEAGGRSSFARRSSRGLLDRLLRRRAARTIIHLERAFPSWFSAGACNWLMPNQERFPRRHLGRLRRVDHVLAKTRHAQAIFAAFGVETVHLGFTSQDRSDPAVEKDWNAFFHLAGGSTLKGTEDLVALWSQNPGWPELLLVQKAENAPRQVPPNVRLLSGYLDDAELRRLQNRCGIHLCPSRSEGWGHHIVEGLSTGAVVLTTDAPPMNELVDADCGILVPFGRSEPRHLGVCYHADRDALADAIGRLLAMPVADRTALGAAARRRYEAIDASFRARARRLFGADDPAGAGPGGKGDEACLP
jgi:glycosyltransferase involved in cell wall biosynthesis